MKLESAKSAYRPITITLETEEDFKSMVRFLAQVDDYCPDMATCGKARELKDRLVQELEQQ